MKPLLQSSKHAGGFPAVHSVPYGNSGSPFPSNHSWFREKAKAVTSCTATRGQGRDKNRSRWLRFGYSQLPMLYPQVTVNYRRCRLTELPVFCNRDDHLVRTLVTARC